MKKISTISSWSGGKDSCLACYKAMQSGYEVKYLLNFISRESKRGCFHGIEGALLKLQADAIGIPLVQKEVSPDMQKYEGEFKEAVSQLQAKGMEAMVFGDIYLLEHESWIERVCGDLKIKAIEPLWEQPVEKIIEEFIGAGFKAIIVSCKADVMGRKFIGRPITMDLIAQLKNRGVCPCGEKGEFHTLVVDGPNFKKRIEILKSKPVIKESYWKHWFMDIQDYRAVDKN